MHWINRLKTPCTRRSERTVFFCFENDEIPFEHPPGRPVRPARMATIAGRTYRGTISPLSGATFLRLMISYGSGFATVLRRASRAEGDRGVECVAGVS